MLIKSLVLIVGAYGTTNLGDDALMVGILRIVRRLIPDNEICVRTLRRAAYLSDWYPETRFIPADSNNRFRTNILLYGGGTQFFSFPTIPTSHIRRMLYASRYIVHPIKLWSRLRKTRRKPAIESAHTAAISIGIGPFVTNSPIEEERARAQLKACEWVSVRDTSSLSFCKQLGHNNVDLHADLCFAKELWCDSTTARKAQKNKINNIGVIVRDWPYVNEGKLYFARLQDSVRRIRHRGIKVRYISFAPEVDTHTLSVLRGQGEDILKWTPWETSITKFTKILSEFDLLITARAHGVIIGAALGLPSIAIEIEPKLRRVTDMLKGGTRIWGAPFLPEMLINKIMAMEKEWHNCCEAILSEAAICASQARECAETLEKYIMKYKSTGQGELKYV